MKRLAMPRSWPLTRKTTFGFLARVQAGTRLSDAWLWVVVLRDVLGVAKSMREAKRALATRKIALMVE